MDKIDHIGTMFSHMILRKRQTKTSKIEKIDHIGTMFSHMILRVSINTLLLHDETESDFFSNHQARSTGEFQNRTVVLFDINNGSPVSSK